VAAVERRDLVGRLVELNPDLAAAAKSGCTSVGLGEVEVVVGDAGHSSAYAGAVPADLVLQCGVFGNISDGDIERTVRATPQLCAPGATVIWTRHRGEPDMSTPVRHWYAESGFEEICFDPVPDSPASVGVMAYRGDPVPLVEQQLFVFNRKPD
jgi:hypothetical protein